MEMKATKNRFPVFLGETENENIFGREQEQTVKELRKNITSQEYGEFLELQALKEVDTLKFLERKIDRFKDILNKTENDFIRGQVKFLLQSVEEEMASLQKSQEATEATSMYKEAETFLFKEQALALGPTWYKKIWWFLKFKLSKWFGSQSRAVSVELSKEELQRALAVVEQERKWSDGVSGRGGLERSAFHHVEAAGFLRRKFCCERKILKVRVFYKRGSGAINQGAVHHICTKCLANRNVWLTDTSYQR